MTQAISWYSEKSTVHHFDPRCPEGAGIESAYRLSGTGGKMRCQHCIRISMRDKQSSAREQ